MPQKRIYCVSLREYRVLAEIDSEDELPATARPDWGEVCLDWIAVRAERSAEAIGKAMAWRSRPLADRKRQSVTTEAWLSVASLVTCGTCS